MLRFSAEARARIGSRWATSWQLFVAGMPVGVMAHLSFVSLDSTTTQVGAALAWSVAGYLAMGVVWWVARVTLFRRADEKPLPVLVVVAFGAVSGSVRAGVSVVGMSASGYVAWDLVPIRTVQGALTGMVLLPIGSYLAASIAQVVSLRRELHESLVSVTAARMESEREGQRLREQITAEIDELVADVVDRVEKVTNKQPGEVRSALRTALDEAIIPTQQRMGEITPAISPGISVWSIIRQAWSLRETPVGLVGVVWAALIIGPEVARESFARGLAVTVISTLVGVAVLLGGRWVTRRWVLPDWSVLVTTVVVAAAIGTVFVYPVRAVGPVLPPRQVLVAAAVLLFEILVINAIRSVVLASRASIETLTSQVDQEQAELEAARRLQAQYRREAARIVHTDVQGALEGVLKSASDPFDSGDADSIVELLRRLQPAGLTTESVDMVDGVRKLASRWAGLVRIDIDTDQSHLVRPATMNAIAECVTNAFRHGGARRVDVVVRAISHELLEIVVVDDGSGLADHIEPGMGSEIIGAGASAGWRREMDPGGGTRVVLACTTQSR